MKNLLIRTAALLLVMTALLASLGTVAFADGTITVDVPVQFRQSEARNMLAQVNQLRQPGSAWYWNEDGSRNEPAGLQPLSYDYGLEQIAMQRATEIVLRFSHTRPNGDICFSATAGGAFSCGENIAYNFDAASSGAFGQWQEADEGYEGQGHRRNMLSGDFTAVGIACVCYQGVYFWVQEFGYSSGAGDPGANNGDTVVPVEVRPDGATVTAQLQGEPSVSLTYGDTAAAPGVLFTVDLNGLVFSSSQPAAADWTAEDGSVVSVEGGMLTGLKAGSTALVSPAYGLRVDVTVAPLSLDGASVSVPGPQSYSGAAITPEPEVSVNGRLLTLGVDYDVSYSDHVEPGTATVVISGKGNYTGTARASFEIVRCEHVWDGDYVIEKAPSCSEGGTEKRTCTSCGFVDIRPVEPLPHSPEDVEEVSPSCTEAGTAAGTRCSVCGVVLSGTEALPALGHSWDPDSVKVSQEASCTQEGSASHSCLVCGAEESYSLPLKAHTPEETAAVAPGCTEEGKTAGSHCAVCGTVLTAQETVPALGHRWDSASEKVLEASTCTQAGTGSHSCLNCGAVETYALPLTAHTPALDPIMAASCTGEGRTAGSHCAVCGAVITAQKTVPAQGHWWMPDSEKVLTPATCDREGLASHECGKCGAVETYALAKKGHRFGAWLVTVPAGAGTEGQQEHICSVCGAKETQTIAAKPTVELKKSAIEQNKPVIGQNKSADKTTAVSGKELPAQSATASSASGRSTASQVKDLGARMAAGSQTVSEEASENSFGIELLLPVFLLVLVAATAAAVILQARKRR